MSFLTEYFQITDENIEEAVCCPFPHYTGSGLSYYETHPSAHVNTIDNLFHCKVCGESGSELQMIEKLLDFFTKPDASSLYAPMFKTLSGNTIFLCQNSQQSNRKNDFERYYFD